MSDSNCDYKWRTGKSCVYKNFVHLVLVTKYRRNVITHEMLLRIKELIFGPLPIASFLAEELLLKSSVST